MIKYITITFKSLAKVDGIRLKVRLSNLETVFVTMKATIIVINDTLEIEHDLVRWVRTLLIY